MLHTPNLLCTMLNAVYIYTWVYSYVCALFISPSPSACFLLPCPYSLHPNSLSSPHLSFFPWPAQHAKIDVNELVGCAPVSLVVSVKEQRFAEVKHPSTPNLHLCHISSSCQLVTRLAWPVFATTNSICHLVSGSTELGNV